MALEISFWGARCYGVKKIIMVSRILHSIFPLILLNPLGAGHKTLKTGVWS